MNEYAIFIASLLITSILIQVSAAFLALRLIRITGRRTAWTLVALAVFLMAMRRSLTLYHMFFGQGRILPDFLTEVVALFSSTLMLAGVHWITPLFLSIKKAQEALKQAHADLERRVKERTAELASTNEQLESEIFGHRLTEEALHESEAKYRTLVEQIPAITYQASLVKASTMLYISPQVESILGFSPGEYKGETNKWMKQIHQDDQDRVQAELIASRVSGKPFICEYRVFSKNGTVKWFRDEATVVKGPKGSPLYLQGVMYDISEEKQAQELLRQSYEEMERSVTSRTAELRQSNESLRLEITERSKAEEALYFEQANLLNILDSLEDGMCIINKDFLMEYSNPALRKYFGPPEGRKCHEYFLDSKKECLWCKSNEVLKGEVLRSEWEFVRNGKTYDVIATPLIDKSGQIRILAMFRDVTTRKQAEEVLRRDKESFERQVDQKTEQLVSIQKQLEQSRRLADLGMLSATVAHELRNPLGVIRTAVYNIRKKAKNEAIETNLSNIEKKIVESDLIINNLLFYSRLKMPAFEVVSVYEVLQECIETIRDRFMGWDVAIHQKLNAIKDDTIEADRLQLSEVFNNILSNAYEAFPEKEGKIEIRGSKDGQGCVEVVFYDNGAGIDEEHLAKIFDPFYSQKSHGTGLGLTICKELVNLHNGTIALSSHKDKGTTCTVVLPMKRAAEK